MPNKTVHCSICRQAITGYDFKERMDKLRKHRKKKHPKAFQESYEKIRSATTHPKVSYAEMSRRGEKPVIEAYKADPEIKKRTKLISRPEVITFKDWKGHGLIRVLRRKDWSLFPEFALYVKLKDPHLSKALSAELHETHDRMLKEAGLTEEETGKWVLRTNKFNLFVYV